MDARQTPLYRQHVQLGARMVPFAGFSMPIQYAGIRQEHEAVRRRAGLFDVSHMGNFFVRGSGALSYLQNLTTNNVAKLQPGDVQYSALCLPTGGVIDDILVYALEPESYMVVVNASNIEKDWNWIQSHNHDHVEMHNISDKTGLLAIQGPNATKILQPLTEMDILNLKYYTFVKGTFAGIDNVLISATGYTGAGGVEIYFEDINDNATHIWNAIFEIGRAHV